MAVFKCKHFQTLFFKSTYRHISRLTSVASILEGEHHEAKSCVHGWVKTYRKMKDVVFVDMHDGSCSKSLQIVIQKQHKPDNLQNGSSIKACGTITKNRNGQLEMQAQEIAVLGTCDPTRFPFSAKQNHSHDYCRQYLHLRPQLAHFTSLLRVRHESMRAIHDWFHDNAFFSIHTPILTSNDCEGAGEVFQVLPVNKTLIQEMKRNKKDDETFFDGPAFLSVSGQMHLEAITRGMPKVYSFSPTFRAENSKSRLHLSEFYMVEAEEAFVENLEDILKTMESFVKGIIGRVTTSCKNDLETILKHSDEDLSKHFQQSEEIVKKDFIRLPYSEALQIIRKQECFNASVDGLTKEHELFLVKHFNCPIFVINWPRDQKPFYMKSLPDSPELVSAVDLLVPNVGELCGGSLRETDVEILQSKLHASGLQDSMKWYLELREFGNVPTGGFGMGFERFLQLVTGLTNIKDTIPFPRWPHSCRM